MGQIGPKSCKIWYFQYILDFSEATRFFNGNCGIPFSRGERARHFELLFVAFYSQLVSTYEVECSKMLQVEPSLKIYPLIFGRSARLQHDQPYLDKYLELEKFKISHDQQTKLFNLSQRIGLKITSASLRLKSLKAIS